LNLVKITIQIELYQTILLIEDELKKRNKENGGYLVLEKKKRIPRIILGKIATIIYKR